MGSGREKPRSGGAEFWLIVGARVEKDLPCDLWETNRSIKTKGC